MTVGVVMLVHTAFDRAEQVIRHWVDGGCPVVVHVDQKVDAERYNAFVSSVADLKQVAFSKRFYCEWGAWGIVAGTQAASQLMLERFPDVRHVYLASGACLPLRPVKELCQYLDRNPQTDFIESATTSDVPWTIGGLDRERFTLRFPFSWKKHRVLFDRYVKLQQRVGFRRKIPNGLVPHMGSQWWCLTRHTLSSILHDPNRATYDRYFKKVWIPDESYFQTLARLHSTTIESRSLTLSKFDYQGKPHIFYDDHLQLLRRSDCFVARKIWPNAHALYEAFPRGDDSVVPAIDPNPSKIDRVFAKAVERRTRGRPGLYMHSRFPNEGRENGLTATPYSVLEGLSDVFVDFEPWLAKATNARVHGHLYAKDRVHFAGGETVFTGALSDNAHLRDYNGTMFLTNLIWNTRGEHQCFQFGPADTQDISWMIAKDTNARVTMVSGAWSIPLFRSNLDFADIRKEAARLQRIENEHLKILRSPYTKARIKIYTLAEFVEAPMDALQYTLDEIAGHSVLGSDATMPKMVNLIGFGQFLQKLKNQGMHPYLMGDFPVDNISYPEQAKPRKSYLVR